MADSGLMPLNVPFGDYDKIAFTVQQMLGKLQTCTLVKVEACSNNGELSPVGFVDVRPMVNQLDAEGLPTPHVTIYNVPYFRIQGGGNAIIIDPKPGDIGLACFSSRDISKVKNARQSGNPGSLRQYSMSDALYIGGFLNGAPTQYIRFSNSGIAIKAVGTVSIESDSLTHNGVNIGDTHVHGGVQAGSSNTDVPQ